MGESRVDGLRWDPAASLRKFQQPKVKSSKQASAGAGLLSLICAACVSMVHEGVEQDGKDAPS